MKKENVISNLTQQMRQLSEDAGELQSLQRSFKDADNLNLLLSKGPVVCSVFNHTTFQFDYLSPNVEQMLGIPSELLKALDYQEFLKRHMHPIDLEVISSKLLPDMVNFITENAKKKTMNVSVHYNYRMKTVIGSWMKIEQQTSPFKLDKEGNILLDQSFYRQSGKADPEQLYPIKLSVFLRDNTGFYHLKFSKSYTTANTASKILTSRETDILQMMSKGKTSDEIARCLNIGETTVITHRRNMLKKLKVKNSNELISYSHQLGLL